MKTRRFGIVAFITVALTTGMACAQQTNQGGGAGAEQVDPAIVDLPISASTVLAQHGGYERLPELASGIVEPYAVPVSGEAALPTHSAEGPEMRWPWDEPVPASH